MITKEEAIKITETFLQENEVYRQGYSVKNNQVEDKDFAWCVPFEEDYPDINNPLVGAYKVLFIDKLNGETMQPGSAYELDKWLYGFKIGLRGKRYDLKILKVNNEQRAIDLLNKMRLQYVRIELENGVEWKIPKTFNVKVIKQRLQKLPCTFQNQAFTFDIDLFNEIIEKKVFEYELEPTNNNNPKIIGELV